MSAAANINEEHRKGRSEKYLTFSLGEEQYGVEILKVKEIIGLMEITKVPRTPEFVRGVINLRGKVIPIIDLRNKFGMEEIEDTEQTCVIVVEISLEDAFIMMGIVVDSVSEVLDIDETLVEDAPAFGAAVSTNFIRGMAKTKEGVKILLNIEEVLTAEELQTIAKTDSSNIAETSAETH